MVDVAVFNRSSQIDTAELDILCGHTQNQHAQAPRGIHTADPRPCMKSSRQGTSIGAVIQAPFLFFGKLILENR